VRLYVIGDEDTVVGFRMAGVDGVVVENAEEASRALQQAEREVEVVVIVPEQVAAWVRPDIDRIRYSDDMPLVVEVPGPGGPTGEAPSLYRLVREAVGIKLEG